LFQTDSTGRLH